VPAAPPPACTSTDYRAFDFWVGNWDVYATGTERMVARSLIERLYGGCAICENWMPSRGAHGGSLSSFHGDGWRQIWVDGNGSWAEFRGGLEGGAMVITGVWPGAAGPGSRPLVRMRYTRGADGTVRQQVFMSGDDGATWQANADFTYRRSAAP
jgi:hypothetical protein